MNMNADYLLLAGWSVVCNVWLGLWIAQSIAKRRGLLLTPHVYTGPKPPSVEILIPARNEGQTIRACLDSVAQQDYQDWSATVIDDRSEDQTAMQVQRFVEQDRRFRLLRIHDRPANWMGKTYALSEGTGDCSADWMLFVDVDCLLDPSALSTVMREAERRDVDLLTLWPRHRGGGFWEHLLIPLFGGVIALWYGTANRSDLRRGPGFANGQFILIRRDKYEQMGGHTSVRHCLIEDIPLAEHAKRSGLRCWVGGGAELISVRMYDSLAGICSGGSRILFGALRSRIKLALSIAWVLLGSLLPFVMLPIILFRVFPLDQARTVDLIALGLCANHLLMIGLVSWRFWGWGGCDRRYLLLYPLSALCVLAVLCQTLAMMCFRRRVCWRGTRYTLTPKAGIIG